MPRKRKDEKEKPLPTIWEIPDDLWLEIERILRDSDPPKRTGRKRAQPRPILNGILFRLRSGCQWNQIPRQFGDDSTVHRTFQKWVRLGVFQKLWAALLKGCEELGGVDWEWQAADGVLGKARQGGISPARIRPIGASQGPNGVC